ncbi:MAG: TetR/AcrR family transcriptional regulator C-terminal domain-containing protein [Chloroflexota bacterium]
MEPLSTPTRRRGPSRRLDESAVVAAALAVLDEGGPQALSVRSVAARLGLQPNALYTYVADRAALERAVAEAVLGTADVDVLHDPALPPRARITAYAHRLRTTLLAHPGVAPLLLSAPMDGPAALLVGELLLGTLADAGLSPDDAARATYLLIVLLVGSVALEVAETDGRAPLPPEEARIAGRRAAMAAIPADALPRTAAAADVMAAWIGTDQLDWMLERTLDGILSRPAPR